MKVLMISKALTVGAYHGKLREMARLGVELTLVMPPRWGKKPAEVQSAAEYDVCIKDCLFSGQNHFHFYRGMPDHIDADLVHIDEDPWSLVTYQWMRHCVRHRKPAIFFTWQNIYKNYPPPFNYFERFSFAHAAAAIAGNAEAEEILRRKQYRKPVAVIPQFGVDPAVFRKMSAAPLRRELQLGDAFVIGYAGRLVREKGIDDLLRATATLPPNCVLVLLGSGPYQPETLRLAAQLGISERVRFIPSIRSLDMPRYLNLFNVLVLPSRTTPHWKEQFGRVLIEAMACEVPAIGSSSGEIPNVISNPELVFPEGNSSALAAILKRLQEDPVLIAQLGNAGRSHVLTSFTHARVAADTAALYGEVLQGLGYPGRISTRPAECAEVFASQR